MVAGDGLRMPAFARKHVTAPSCVTRCCWRSWPRTRRMAISCGRRLALALGPLAEALNDG